MEQFNLELDGKWVLAHFDDDELPIERLKPALMAAGYIVLSPTLTSLYAYKEGDRGEEQFRERIGALLADFYPEEDIDGIFSVHLTTNHSTVIIGQEDEAEDEEDGETDDIDDIDDDDNNTDDDDETDTDGETDTDDDSEEKVLERLLFQTEDPMEREGPAEVVDRVSALIGADEFKQFIDEIVAVAPYILRDRMRPVFMRRCYLFSIGDGCGLTTCLELFAKTVTAVGLCNIPSKPIEMRLGSERDGRDDSCDVMGVLKRRSKEPRLLCIDISEWMGKTNDKNFRHLLSTIEKNAGKDIVVFRVPFLDEEALDTLNRSLGDLLSIQTVSFPPFCMGELKIFAEKRFTEYGFHVTKKALDAFRDRIMEEKSDGKFYGLNTVEKVVRELIYYKEKSNAERGCPDFTIGGKEAALLCRKPKDVLSGEEELERLIGNEQVKRSIEEIVAQIELSAKEGGSDRPCIHMRFVGNPGTGKTTVARILGKLLKERGLLRVGNFYEYSGRDLCGRYIGETAPKTAGICREAYGSVLFIDEAYSLFRGDDNERDFGREAIDTLIAEMENHRRDLVVIMAGYTDDMEKLMRGNHGLASRMPYTIEFPNFTREQLYEIYVSMAEAKFRHDGGLFDAAHRYFMELPDEVINAKGFSNARFVRNLFERTWAKAALRSRLEHRTDVVLTKDDFEHASREREFSADLQQKRKLGF